MLPLDPFDGMIFLDAFSVQWVYNAENNCWLNYGKLNTIPVADNKTTGLMPKGLKATFNTVQQKGGGFAIITKPLLQFRNASNPDGVLFGPLTIQSQSLNFKCVNADGDELTAINCSQVPCFKETDELPPGFDISFSEKFLNSLCIEVPGGSGPRGPIGDQGKTGKDGTGDGPRGEQGDPGKDATTHSVLTGVKIIDTDDIYDTAVVKLELKPEDGVLLMTKGKVKLPTDDSLPAEEFMVSKIIRTIKFNDCMKYTIGVVPCMWDMNAADEITNYDVVDPLIAFYPTKFDPNNLLDRYQPVRGHLSDLINDVISFYDEKLTEANDTWDKAMVDFIEAKDKEARQVIDDLAAELATAESKNNLEFCLGINEQCPDVSVQETDDPAYQTLVTDLGGDPDASSTTSITKITLTGDITPVFSYDPPVPFELPGVLSGGITEDQIAKIGAWYQYPEGAMSYTPDGVFVPQGTVIYPGLWGCGILPPKTRCSIIPNPSDPVYAALLQDMQDEADEPHTAPERRRQLLDEIDRLTGGYPSTSLIAGLFNDWIVYASAKLADGHLQYKKTAIPFTGGALQYPPGTYAFVYTNGGFTQPIYNEKERHGLPPQDGAFIQGDFQRYFAGNEGGGGNRGPFFILNPFNRASQHFFDSSLATTAIGIQIGFAPVGYTDLVPSDYFAIYKYEQNYPIGVAAQEVPPPFVATQKLDAAVIAMENQITWYDLPIIGAKDDVASLRDAYGATTMTDRAVIITAATSGYFFARVRLAFNATEFFGSMIMPPVAGYPSATGSSGGTAPAEYFSTNRAMIYERDRYAAPTMAVKPFAIGSVNMQVLKVDITPSGTTP